MQTLRTRRCDLTAYYLSMARCSAWATPYLLGLVVLLLPSRPSLAAAAAFSCSLSLTGTSSYPADLTFSDVSLGCVPVPPTSAAETLSLQVHPDLFTLYHESFTGTGDMLLTVLTFCSLQVSPYQLSMSMSRVAFAQELRQQRHQSTRY